MAKVIDLNEFKQHKLISAKYSQFNDLTVQISRAIDEAQSYIQKNNLLEVKSNDRAQADLARLCLYDLLALEKRLNLLADRIQIIQSKADVLPFPVKKKAA